VAPLASDHMFIHPHSSFRQPAQRSWRAGRNHHWVVEKATTKTIMKIATWTKITWLPGTAEKEGSEKIAPCLDVEGIWPCVGCAYRCCISISYFEAVLHDGGVGDCGGRPLDMRSQNICLEEAGVSWGCCLSCGSERCAPIRKTRDAQLKVQ